MGSWILNLEKKGEDVVAWWQDPVAMWHRKTNIGYADGHFESHKWISSSFIKWSRASYESAHTDLDRRPANDEEKKDVEFMQRGYAYKELLK